MKELKKEYLSKAAYYYLKMLKEQDTTYPNARKVNMYDYHYNNNIEKTTPIKEEQREIKVIIESYIFSPTKSIVEALQEKGYTIV